MEALLKRIDQIGYVSDGLRTYLQQHVKPQSLNKSAFLLEAGQISNKMYFVEAGLLRGYYLKDGKEVTTWIMAEGEVVISILSFYTQKPSYEYIEAIEDCRLWTMSYDKVTQGYELFPEFNFIARKFTERYYVLSEYRSYYLRMHTAEERFKLLINDFPTILARVKQKDVASLLGISAETLSRILAKKL